MQTLRSDMQAMKYHMTIKLSGMMAASVAVVAALIKLLDEAANAEKSPATY